MRSEAGQASVEWVGAVLVVALALGAAVAIAPVVDGRSFGSWLAHRLVCAARSCGSEDGALRAAYGAGDARLVRRYAPGLVYEPGTYTLPVDFRECRSHRCSDAPDRRDLDAHRSRDGTRATAFTHVVRDGGETFIQYWLYYPDSVTTAANLAGLANRTGLVQRAGGGAPGSHRDDWESVQVRIDRSGRAWVRASSHHGYQGCKHLQCRNRWVPFTGWSRVSRGSHAGHVPMRDRPRPGFHVRIGKDPGADVHRELIGPAYPGVDLRERTTSSAGMRLFPVESVDRSAYRRLDPGISPPWDKEVYEDPRSDSTS
ncbi:MAG TPA: hypothetical protein VNT32_00790 [Thermoleophilaceae bacterium]|nr:hypothetical protein [Thermoleophilaceae bacterium]